MSLSTLKPRKRPKYGTAKTKPATSSESSPVLNDSSLGGQTFPPVFSTLTINDLSDDALIHIFEYFSLQEILSIFRPVCTRWESAVGSFCAPRRSLKLFQVGTYVTYFGREVSIYSPAHYARLRLRPAGSDHDLVLSGTFNAESCRLFQRLFPQIKSLLIEDNGTIFPHLSTLLNGWPDLVTFSLHGFLPVGSAKKQQRHLYEALGRQSQLRHLDLLCSGLYGIHSSLKVMAPVLGRLEHFSALVRNTPIKDYFLSALTPSCTSLRLENFPKVHLLASYMKPESFQAVTHLGVTKTKLSEAQLSSLCEAFPAVIDLTLEWGIVSKQFSLRFSHIVTQLSKLPTLEVLRLQLPYELVREEVLRKSPATCPTVRQLTLPVTMTTDFGKVIQSRSLYVFLADAFPNLQELTVYTTNTCKSTADYEVERAMRPRLLQYVESLWPRGQLRSFTVEEPLEPFGRHKEAYLVRQHRYRTVNPSAGYAAAARAGHHQLF